MKSIVVPYIYIAEVYVNVIPILTDVTSIIEKECRCAAFRQLSFGNRVLSSIALLSFFKQPIMKLYYILLFKIVLINRSYYDLMLTKIPWQ